MRAPEPISGSHGIADFASTNEGLNAWLKERALLNEQRGASRTFVICESQKVIGYYCLSQGAVAHQDVSAKLRRNMPDPIPVTLLGRLAVDRRWSGQGLGRGLLQDAVLRCQQASRIVASAGILVHAFDEPAAHFYLKYGFARSPKSPLHLMMSLHQ
jgi:GNAT superfamily N-acetyltransferase